ncbi:uncharacterized protein [Saccopteryx leptura]|uniref:uncharacterized protein n=1 Tax=Saccopteryx leptura TaxID=249018 RepID=UPI00339C622B
MLPLKPSEPTAPTSSLYPPLPSSVLPESQTDLILLDSGLPPPYPRDVPAGAAGSQPEAPHQNERGPSGEGPAQGTRSRRAQTSDDVAVTLPLRPFGPPVPGGQGGDMLVLQYWPFSSSDLYNWKNNNPPFSEDPVKLTDLLESLMFSHQPTWDDCQQLLGILFTSEERERILLEARKLVPGPDGRPTQLPNLINENFPLRRPNWDPNTPEGRRQLLLYRQTLMMGLRAAARRPTNLAKVREIIQGSEESPSRFLERLMEAYRRYTPFDPESEDQKGALAMAFIGQSATDIQRKLQRMDGLQDMALRDLVKEAEKVFYKRETAEEKEQRLEKEREEQENKLDKRRNKELTKILATVVGKQDRKGKHSTSGPNQKPKLGPNQCAYCKEEGHWGRRSSDPLPELRVTFNVEGTPIDFEVDTGAVYSALQNPLGPLSNKKSLVQGANGCQHRSWTTKRTMDLGRGKVQHSFLVIPECPAPLLGRDLLTKLGASIDFKPQGPEVRFSNPLVSQPVVTMLTLSAEDEYKLYETPAPGPHSTEDRWLQSFPEAWAETAGPGLAVQRPPVVVYLKPSATPVRVKQYYMSKEAREGIRPHLKRLLGQGILRPCQSEWNTPLLPVKKPGTGDYRPVQDLREVNSRVMDIHPTVPNPYNLLSTLSPDRKWYTVLDLKDAFFCLRLHEDCQPLFAFEWTDPENGLSGQLTWTRLPQGFKNSPTIFDEALHQDLSAYRASTPEVTLLQYVDDLLLAAATREQCKQGTEKLLAELAKLGYRASAKKAQICQPEVTFLGYSLRDGKRWLTEARKKTVTQIPPPKNRKGLREFLGTAGFCRLWIPGFAAQAAPLYPLLKDGTEYTWGDEQQKAFDQIKRALLSAPALALPNIEKPFTLYVDEKEGIAKGVLTQSLGPWKRPVAYLSKRLDAVAKGWPGCLRVIAAVALLVKDADKLTLGQKLTVVAPQALESIIRQPPDRWLTNVRITHYQSLLLDKDRITFGSPTVLNPATLLPREEGGTVHHQCRDILAEEAGIRKDLRDTPLPQSDLIWYTDGSSFLYEGERRAGAAVVDKEKVIWSERLAPGTSAQKAELIALTKALELASGKRATVYTDSRYAFATAHVHGAIYKERGLLTSAGKDIKHKQEILALLDAIMLPRELAIVHCPGHQKGQDPVAKGNRRADEEARAVAMRTASNILTIEAEPSPTLTHLEEPEDVRKFLQMAHHLTHLGTDKLVQLLQDDKTLTTPEKRQIAKEIVKACKACQMVNAYPTKGTSGTRLRGTRPGQYWEVDFTEVTGPDQSTTLPMEAVV